MRINEGGEHSRVRVTNLYLEGCLCYDIKFEIRRLSDENKIIRQPMYMCVYNGTATFDPPRHMCVYVCMYSQIRFIATSREETKAAQNIAIIRMLQ